MVAVIDLVAIEEIGGLLRTEGELSREIGMTVREEKVFKGMEDIFVGMEIPLIQISIKDEHSSEHLAGVKVMTPGEIVIPEVIRQ
jgi:hypothetical protein